MRCWTVGLRCGLDIWVRWSSISQLEGVAPMRYMWVVLLAVLLSLVLAGCGGSPDDEVAPAPGGERMASVGAEVTVAPVATLPVVKLLPTVVVPEVADTPVAALQSTEVSPADTQAVAFGFVPLTEEEVKGLECQTRFRDVLVGYEEGAGFAAEVVDKLAREFLESRPDCKDIGWSPAFNFERVCVRESVAGVRLPNGLLDYVGSMGIPQSVGTARDEGGNMIIHFAKMPMEDAQGCWFYEARKRSWHWFVGGDVRSRGTDGPVFPSCEARLKELLEEEALGGGLSAAHAGQLVQYVYFEFGDECPREIWSPFPLSGSVEWCGDGWSTGVMDDGTVAVNWYGRYAPASGALCWVLPSGSSEWREYFDGPKGLGWERRGKVIESFYPVSGPPSVESLEVPEGMSLPRVVEGSIRDLPELEVIEDWYKGEEGIRFYVDARGDHTLEAVQEGHSHRELVYFEGYPGSIPNFHGGSLEYLLAVELMFGAKETLPMLDEPFPFDVNNLSRDLGWELVNAPGVVVNVWGNVFGGGGGVRPKFKAGGVMRLEERSVGQGENRIDYLVLGDWIGPVAVERD